MDIRPVLNPEPKNRVHRAGWVMVDPDTLIPNGYVRVENGVIRETGVYRRGMENVADHGPGLLIPALVNTHTHLELSALKGKLPFGAGFETWVRELLKTRESLGPEGLVRGLGQGIHELLNSGSLVAGDVSTLGIVENDFMKSDLCGVLFREYLGNGIPEDPGLEDRGRFVRSLAGHAPHTTAPELLKHLKKSCLTSRKTFSIHLAESRDETEFVTTGKGAWAAFLEERGIDFSAWGMPFRSPVAYLDHLGLLDSGTLAVHLIRADREDIRILKQRGAHVCLCLRSNWNLHGRVPDVETMRDEGVRLCLGTDSLASTETLSVYDEMVFFAGMFPNVPMREIIRMATVNGAAALGLGKRYGKLEPGMEPAMIYMTLEADTESQLFDGMVA
jgi:cytosine/adenosine deaminase-related metal-dependent hydrolase